MLGDINRSSTVFTTQGQTLCHAQKNQDDGSSNAPAFVVRQNAHQESGDTHDDDGHQEGVLATDHVAQHAKHQRAEGAHDEACGKSQQGKYVAGVFWEGGEELRANDGGQSAVKVKVVPLKNGAG